MADRRAAVVTGGASGIGAAVCRRLAADGRAVGVLDRDAPAADALAGELEAAGARALALPADVTDGPGLQRALDAAAAAFDGLGVLVTSAGLSDPVATAAIEDARWQHVLDINLGGTLRAARAAYPHLAAAGGAVVAISSIAALVGFAQRPSYCASKAGVEGLVRALAVEWAPDGIRVNGVAPGFVQTPMAARAAAGGHLDEAGRQARVPLGRWAEASEIAGVVSFLTGPDASYVTGHVLVADGGVTSSFTA